MHLFYSKNGKNSLFFNSKNINSFKGQIFKNIMTQVRLNRLEIP